MTYNAWVFFFKQGDVDSKDSMRYALLKEWASLKKLLKLQPLDAVRDYFGVKVAMYFAWLGFYTNMLVFPAVIGLIVFIYGLVTLESNVPRCIHSDSLVVVYREAVYQ